MKVEFLILQDFLISQSTRFRLFLYNLVTFKIFDKQRHTLWHLNFVLEQRPLNKLRHILGKGTLFNSVDLANFIPHTAVTCLITDSLDVIHSYWV